MLWNQNLLPEIRSRVSSASTWVLACLFNVHDFLKVITGWLYGTVINLEFSLSRSLTSLCLLSLSFKIGTSAFCVYLCIGECTKWGI